MAAKQARYRKTIGGLFNSFKHNAKSRDLDFLVTKEYFGNLLQFKCFYCGGESDSIDRVYNTLGYIYGNLVGCCKECNLFKHKFDLQYFIKKCREISKTTNDLKIQ